MGHRSSPLEKAKAEKEAHGDFESERPGYCGADQTAHGLAEPALVLSLPAKATSFGSAARCLVLGH